MSYSEVNLAMSSYQELIEPETVRQASDRASEVVFDPLLYFDQWWEQVQVFRVEPVGEPTTDDGSRMSIESLPGSNCEVEFEGVLHFDGHSMGNIKSPGGALIVTKRGRVDADIDVGVAVISGVVEGNITASERVFLDSDALVKGQIYTRRLSVKAGAIFDGDCVFIDAEEQSPYVESPDQEEELEYLMAGV
jgi:cytoskeletal protein CcmA (bactofilin family)